MRNFVTFAARGFLAAALMGALPALAAGNPVPAHRAAAKPPVPGSACMDNSRYVSHVAYIPSRPDQVMSCGHLLSTDTLLSVRHWDKT